MRSLVRQIEFCRAIAFLPMQTSGATQRTLRCYCSKTVATMEPDCDGIGKLPTLDQYG